jgi:hypothetical protein
MCIIAIDFKFVRRACGCIKETVTGHVLVELIKHMCLAPIGGCNRPLLLTPILLPFSSNTIPVTAPKLPQMRYAHPCGPLSSPKTQQESSR